MLYSLTVYEVWHRKSKNESKNNNGMLIMHATSIGSSVDSFWCFASFDITQDVCVSYKNRAFAADFLLNVIAGSGRSRRSAMRTMRRFYDGIGAFSKLAMSNVHIISRHASAPFVAVAAAFGQKQKSSTRALCRVPIGT